MTTIKRSGWNAKTNASSALCSHCSLFEPLKGLASYLSAMHFVPWRICAHVRANSAWKPRTKGIIVLWKYSFLCHLMNAFIIILTFICKNLNAHVSQYFKLINFNFYIYFINIWMRGGKICKHKILVILTNVIFNALNVRTRACIPSWIHEVPEVASSPRGPCSRGAHDQRAHCRIAGTWRSARATRPGRIRKCR